eukprot:10948822-Karenia_brevis.AAC.1
MSQHSSRPNLAVLLHFGHIGPRHNTAHEPILPLFATLSAHRTTSQHNPRANLAAIRYASNTLDH